MFQDLYQYISEMDFKSQRQLSIAYRLIIIITAIFTTIRNVILKDNLIGCFYDISIVTAILLIVMVPAWPCWKRNSLKFQKQKQLIKKNS